MFRVPVGVLDAIDDTGQHIRARAKQTVEAEAVLRRLDFASVSWTNGVDPIAEDDAALHQVHVSVKLEPVWPEKPQVEPDILQRSGAEDALISEIVNREQQFDTEEGRIRTVCVTHKGSDQRGLPIVAMEDVRPENATNCFHRRTAKNGKSDVIIGIILVVQVVNAIAIVESRAVDEIVGDAVFDHLVDARAIERPGEPHWQVVINTLRRKQFDSSIFGQDHGDVVAASHQRRR